MFAVRVLFLNWRDTRNPEGGGSERYVESVATRLAGEGHVVTVFCAAHEAAPGNETIDGVRYVRRGSKLGVYPQALWHLVMRRLGRIDVVVDVQNGMPFFSRLVTRKPVVVLVHHVHREVWPVAVGPLAARVGWFLESRLAPLVYRNCDYVTVSQATRGELINLGVRADQISVVHNGTEAWSFPDAPRSSRPGLCVVGRLVPHKRVEDAVTALADLPDEMDAELHVIGHGYWQPHIEEHARRLGVTDRVHLHGYLDDAAKHELLSSSWLHLCPSLKEGWGLVCIEAGRHGVPTVAYGHAGGVVESVQSGDTGLLVHDSEDFTKAVHWLIENHDERARLGRQAREFARNFSWDRTAKGFADLLADVVQRGQRLP